MNNKLFFLCCASAVVILSIITIVVAPIINGVIGSEWGTLNCKKESDTYENNKDKKLRTEKQLEYDKKLVDECNNQKAMYELEYTSLTIDVILGFVCAVLGLLHFFDSAKSFEKYTGLIGLISGAIGVIITIIYVGYSSDIFNNEIYDRDNSPIEKLYSNRAIYHFENDKYVKNFDEDEGQTDPYIKYIKYKDLGSKQYNYDSDYFKAVRDSNSEISKCSEAKYLLFFLSDTRQKYSDCEYIYKNNEETTISRKYIYDRWLTSIIFSVLIAVCACGLALFGFLLFKGNSSSS